MSKFKVGDRVTLKKAVDVHINGELTQIVPGEIGYIDWADGNEMEVYFVDYVKLDLYASQVELVEPTDRKTAFLEELRELLRKHNASLVANSADSSGLSLDVYIGKDCIASFDMDYDSEDYKGRLTPDNIMDYGKEGV